MIGQIIIMNYGVISMIPLYENIRLQKHHLFFCPLDIQNESVS